MDKLFCAFRGVELGTARRTGGAWTFGGPGRAFVEIMNFMNFISISDTRPSL
jgi:hypothetical protein